MPPRHGVGGEAYSDRTFRLAIGVGKLHSRKACEQSMQCADKSRTAHYKIVGRNRMSALKLAAASAAATTLLLSAGSATAQQTIRTATSWPGGPHLEHFAQGFAKQ